jgi:hypothetical protein
MLRKNFVVLSELVVPCVDAPLDELSGSRACFALKISSSVEEGSDSIKLSCDR